MTLSCTASPWGQSHYVPSKCQELLAQWHSVTSQKNGILKYVKVYMFDPTAGMAAFCGWWLLRTVTYSELKQAIAYRCSMISTYQIWRMNVMGSITNKRMVWRYSYHTLNYRHQCVELSNEENKLYEKRSALQQKGKCLHLQIQGVAEITPTFWRSIKIKRKKVHKKFFYL